MNNLTEKQIRDIVKDEMTKNYFSGNPMISPHSHNGTDNLQINPVDLMGWTPMPQTTQQYTNDFTGLQEYGFASPQQLVGGSSLYPSQTVSNLTIAQYPLPIVEGSRRAQGYPSGDFNGGYAPQGTLILFQNGVNLELHARYGGQWHGVELTIIT